MSDSIDTPTEEELEKFRNAITESIGKEDMEFMVHMATALGVLEAVAEVGYDLKAIAASMFESKKVIPEEDMFFIAIDKLPFLVEDGLIDFNGLTEEGKHALAEHLKILQAERRGS